MDVNEVISAIGGPVQLPAKPDGDPNHAPLAQLGLDKPEPESAPANVESQQGAGGAGYLTPGATGQASDGTVEPGNVHDYAGPQPEQAEPSQIDRLTASVVNRPEGGGSPAAAPVGRPDYALGRDQGQGQEINPALKAALTPRQPGQNLFKKL